MIEGREIPDGWIWTTLGEIRKDQSKGIEPNKFPEEYFELYSVPSFGSGRPEIIPGSDIGSSKQIVETGAVLLCKINPRINRAWVVGNYSDNMKIASTEWIPFFKLQEVIPAYLRYYLALSDFRDYLASRASGVGGSLMRIKGSTFEHYPFPLAPFPEQQRIVEAIEQQFSRLDEAVTLLHQAQKKLKRYRASVLKAAVEGKLTREWREIHPDIEPASELLKHILAERRAEWEEEQIAKGKDPKKVKYVESAAPDERELPGLPEGWYWATVEQITARSEYGTSTKCDYEANGVPVLRIPNIAAGEISLDNIKYSIQPLELEENDALQSGDILVCRTNGSVSLIGKGALVRRPLETLYTFASYLLRFRLFETRILPQWFHLFITSPQGRSFIEKHAASSAGQHNISLTLMHSMALPLPPSSEQEQIVSLVEERLSIISELETAIEKALKRAERQRQSILHRAFTGKLVPQDPNDEPASVLLERIRREREELAAQKDGKQQRAHSTRHKKADSASKTIRTPDKPAEPIDTADISQESLWQGVEA